MRACEHACDRERCNQLPPLCRWAGGEGARDGGNKERERQRKEIEKGNFAQPSITLLGAQDCLASFFFETPHRGGGGAWEGGKRLRRQRGEGE